MDFFREPDPDLHMRTPGAQRKRPCATAWSAAKQTVALRRPLQHLPECLFGDRAVLASTDFERQRTLLRDSVYTMLSHHVTEPEMRELLERLGEAHNRNNRNVLPTPL